MGNDKNKKIIIINKIENGKRPGEFQIKFQSFFYQKQNYYLEMGKRGKLTIDFIFG